MKLRKPLSRFEEIYKLYKEAFPDIERRTKEAQKRVFSNDRYQIRVIEKEDKNILAFLGYWNLPGCVFLEHLATALHSRGNGFGKQLVEEVLKETNQPVFLEIDPVVEEDPMTGRRADFYKRMGFLLNDFSYEQLPLKPSDEPIPLWMMSYGKNFSEEEFKPYRDQIYQIVYSQDCSKKHMVSGRIK